MELIAALPIIECNTSPALVVHGQGLGRNMSSEGTMPERAESNANTHIVNRIMSMSRVRSRKRLRFQ